MKSMTVRSAGSGTTIPLFANVTLNIDNIILQTDRNPDSALNDAGMTYVYFALYE